MNNTNGFVALKCRHTGQMCSFNWGVLATDNAALRAAHMDYMRENCPLGFYLPHHRTGVCRNVLPAEAAAHLFDAACLTASSADRQAGEEAASDGRGGGK